MGVPGDGVISTIHARGVNARFGLPLSGVLCLGLIDHSLQRLEGRVTTAVRLDASCVRPQLQERHNVNRSICRSSFAGLGMIRLVLCAFRVHIFYLMLALTRDESSRLHARFHHPWPCEVSTLKTVFLINTPQPDLDCQYAHLVCEYVSIRSGLIELRDVDSLADASSQ